MNLHSNGSETLQPEFWSDFHKTIFAIPGTLLEIAFAAKGTSAFNSAIYHESLTVEHLQRFAKTDSNVALLSGCDSKYLLAEKGVKTKRLGNNQCIRHKNIVIFDFDFKENIPNFESLDHEAQQKEGSELIEVIKSKIASEGLPLWLLNFSGHGLHFYFKLADPIETHNSKEYTALYQNLSAYLGGVLGGSFDKACSNLSRLIRMPGSINWKDVSNPISCALLHFAPESYSDALIAQYAKKLEVAKPRNFQGRHEILQRLDLLKVLSFFDYKKLDSISETKDKIVCSSPFSSDKTPSFHFDKSLQVFYDFSTAKSGDLFNLIALQAGLEIKRDFKKVVQYAKKIAGLLEESRADEPGRYELKDDGVWFLSSNETSGGSYWVSSYLDVIAMSRNLQGQGWGRILQIRDSEGNEKTWPMPMEMLAGDGLELRKKLLDLGVQLSPAKTARNHLLSYLSSLNPKRFCRAIKRLGWHEDSFVFPERICSKESQQANIVLADPAAFAKFSCQGTLTEWQGEIGAYAQGNPLLQLALAAAFAPVLLHITCDENFGFHLVGPSSIGKTIILDVAGSVWGGGGVRGYKTRWRSTLNGLEALASKHNDTLLVLDELAEVVPHAAANAAYMLANGSGKVRGGKEGGLQEQLEWRTVFLSAGEIDLATHLETDNQKTRAGQEVRMISLEALRSKDLGAFDYKHGFEDSAGLADHLRLASQKTFGAPSRAYIGALLKHPNPQQRIKELKAIFKAMVPERLHGQAQRVLEHFALVYAAGAFAIEFGVLNFSKDELAANMRELFRGWVKANAAAGDLEAESYLSQIRLYLQTYGASRFSEFDDRSNTKFDANYCAGFRKKNANGSVEWLVLADVFKKEICKGLNFKAVLNLLVSFDLVRTSKDQVACVERLPLFGPTRVYAFNEKIFDSVTFV